MSVKEYIHKPTTSKAIMWDGTNFEEIWEFLGKNRDNVQYHYTSRWLAEEMEEINIEGLPIAFKGDFVIKHEDGRFEVLKEEIFKQEYEDLL